MPSSLYIENYRLFKKLDIPKFGRVNLITGKNNIGKTALLEAIRIYASDGDFSVINNIIYNRDDWGNNNIIDDYSSLFFLGNYINTSIIINELDIKLSKDSLVVSDLRYQNNPDLELREALTKRYKLGTIGYKYPREEAVIITTAINQNNNDYWKKIALTYKEEIVLGILKLVEPRLEKISIDTNIKATRVLLKKSQKPVPIKNLGDGMRRLLTIAIGLVSAEDSCLLIDEFDIGLHYSVQEKLWDIVFKVSKELNVQVFVTTHSRDCIRAFTEVALKYEEHESQYFRLQRKRNSEDIIVVEYTSDDLETALLSNIETR